MNKRLEISYKEYNSIQELTQVEQELAKAAILATKTSYAPYSRFNVGAAILLDNGKVISGSNQENAASPSGLCAERVAFFTAGAQYPGVPVRMLAVAAGPDGTICDNPATPCGACRQVMAEYQKLAGAPISIMLVGNSKIMCFEKVDDILPFIFDSLD